MRALLWVPLVLVSCIVPAPTAEKGPEKQKTAAAAAPAAPVEVRSGANFDDKVELVGATFSPGRAAPGEAVRVTAFWKVNQAIAADYTIFVHIEDVDGKVDRLNADHMPVQGTYPTSKWKVGETVKDEFTIYVPPGMAVRGLNVLIGLWDSKSDQRMVVKNADSVRTDNNNRVLLAQIPRGSELEMALTNEVEAAIASRDATTLAKLATAEELEKLKVAEDVIRLAAERTRSSFTLALVSQLMVGVVAVGGLLVNFSQSRGNKQAQLEQQQINQARWNKEFQRAQRADKYRAFFETSVLATDPTNPDKRLVGYALLQEFVEDEDYNSKATLMLEESLMQELRGDTKAGLDEAHRNAAVAIVTALAQSNDCHALGRASRSISRVAQKNALTGDADETAEIFGIYVRRLVGRAAVICKTMKDLEAVRRPLVDALERAPEIVGAKGHLKDAEAFARVAQVLIDRCTTEVAITGAGECGPVFEKYVALCGDGKSADQKDEQSACALIRTAAPAMAKPAPPSAAPTDPE